MKDLSRVTSGGRNMAARAAWSVTIMALGAVAVGCSASGDGDEPGPRRVESEAELSRMQTYLDERYPSDAVVLRYTNESGEDIDCVDVLAQPTLLAPETRGLTLRARPPFAPADAADGDPDARRPDPSAVPVTGVARCPDGTVPVRHLDLDTVARFRDIRDFHRKYPSHLAGREGVGIQGEGAGLRAEGIEAPRPVGSIELHEHAIGLSWTAHRGIESWLDVRAPYVSLPDEFSLSQQWVISTRSGTTHTAESGSQVYRNLYGDWQPHLFVYYTADDYLTTGCYNLGCGFVQVDNSVTLGGALTPGVELDLFWYKWPSNNTGDWWFAVNGVWVGYYPNSLFPQSGLGDYADRMDFGGEIVDDTPGQHTPTDMGTGAFGTAGPAAASHHRNIKYVTTSNSWNYKPALTAISSKAGCYSARAGWDNGTWIGGLGPSYNYGTYVLFGGSGYDPVNCPQ